MNDINSAAAVVKPSANNLVVSWRLCLITSITRHLFTYLTAKMSHIYYFDLINAPFMTSLNI